MKRWRVTAVLGVCALAACGQDTPPPQAAALPPIDGAWTIDYDASRVEFSGTQTGKAFTGSFQNFSAAIVLVPAALASARIEAVIETGSAKTGDRQRDGALLGAEWFSSMAFPEARFASTSVTAAGDGAYAAVGKLSIRGAEKAVILPFSLTIEDGRATAEGAITLNRADFGVGQGEEFATDKWVGYDVKVSVHIEATR